MSHTFLALSSLVVSLIRRVKTRIKDNNGSFKQITTRMARVKSNDFAKIDTKIQ